MYALIIIILTIISTIFVSLVSDLPPSVSDIPDGTVYVYHFMTILLARAIIGATLSGKFKLYAEKFYLFFLIGYTISLSFDFFYWIPLLIHDYSSDVWGAFDPVKYYAMAHEMAKGTQLNHAQFFPVVYIYLIEFNIFGVHPLVPFFINSLGFLYAVLLITKYLNSTNIKFTGYYTWLLLIPEVLYYNLTASKDIICLICATIIFVHSQKILRQRFTINSIIIPTIALFVMFVARASMALMSILSVLVFYVNFRKLNLRSVLFVISAGIGYLLVSNFWSVAGLHDSTSAQHVTTLASEQLSGDTSNSVEFSDGSAGVGAKALVPHNSVEFVVFGIIRSFITAFTSPKELIDLFNFQNLNFCVRITGVLMSLVWLMLPLVLKYKEKFKDQNVTSLALVTLIFFLAVGMSTPLMVVKRYRIVYDLLFFALAIKTYLILYKDTYKRTIRWKR